MKPGRTVLAQILDYLWVVIANDDAVIVVGAPPAESAEILASLLSSRADFAPLVLVLLQDAPGAAAPGAAAPPARRKRAQPPSEEGKSMVSPVYSRLRSR